MSDFFSQSQLVPRAFVEDYPDFPGLVRCLHCFWPDPLSISLTLVLENGHSDLPVHQCVPSDWLAQRHIGMNDNICSIEWKWSPEFFTSQVCLSLPLASWKTLWSLKTQGDGRGTTSKMPPWYLPSRQTAHISWGILQLLTIYFTYLQDCLFFLNNALL